MKLTQAARTSMVSTSFQATTVEPPCTPSITPKPTSPIHTTSSPSVLTLTLTLTLSSSREATPKVPRTVLPRAEKVREPQPVDA